MSSDGSIHIPGLEGDVFVISVLNEYHILPTKTRPKKCTFVGSDGKQYSYLLKGNEDLHLDERIQQFVTVSNMLLKKDSATSEKKLSAKTYSVIPIGAKFGIIQWVDGVSGIFSVYRKWQQWDHTCRSLQKKDSNIPPPLRPHEQFLSKIQKAISSGKFSKDLSRSKWPIDVLKDVFLQLQSETPSDILYNELWCSSSSSTVLYKKRTVFARSLAVMSIIGYILGLGDRHLDNILIDLENGALTHIDFNICFEKGANLRIPETVPFRFTQNLQTACGAHHEEGYFRKACENTLRVMKENKEILLTLLEIFLFDPLLDWKRDNSSEMVMINLNVNIGLLISRIGIIEDLLFNFVDESRPSILDLVQQFSLQLDTFDWELLALNDLLKTQSKLLLEKHHLEKRTSADDKMQHSHEDKDDTLQIEFVGLVNDIAHRYEKWDTFVNSKIVQSSFKTQLTLIGAIVGFY